jgi:WD40 repeat protein
MDADIRVWNAQTGSQLGIFSHPDKHVNSMVFLANNVLVSASGGSASKSTVRFWDVKTGAGCGILELDTLETLFLAVPSAGKLLIASAPVLIVPAPCGIKITFWDAITGLPQRQILVGTDERLSLALSPDGKFFALGSGDKINIWNSTTGALHVTLKGHTGGVRKKIFSPNSHLLAALLFCEVVL